MKKEIIRLVKLLCSIVLLLIGCVLTLGFVYEVSVVSFIIITVFWIIVYLLRRFNVIWFILTDDECFEQD